MGTAFAIIAMFFLQNPLEKNFAANLDNEFTTSWDKKSAIS